MICKSVGAKHDETVLEISKEKAALIRKVFGISDLELETVMKEGKMEDALSDLVIECMALLATQK